MKIAICGDIHISKTSSIIKSRGEKYSTRIENCLKSINWFEEVSRKKGCQMEIFLGDTFDKPQLSDEELTAIKDINWNDIDKYFIVGNHESSVNGLEYNSAKALEGNHRYVISDQGYNCFPDNKDDIQIHFLPYIIESDRQPLENYLNRYNDVKYNIIFSHNDIEGIQMGSVVSKIGFSIEEIENNCDLFINGHLHNGGKVGNKIINLGILTGQTLNEDASKYPHNIMILDTETLEYELIENPYAFNFYNIEINNINELDKLNGLKNNAVLSIKCDIELLDKVKEKVEYLNNVIQYRVTTFRINKDIKEIDKVEDFSIDYLEKFKDFCMMSIDNKEILKEELSEVLK